MVLYIFQVSDGYFIVNRPREFAHLASTAALMNANQLAQQYTTAIACSLPNGTNPATTLLTTANTNQSPLALSSLQQHHHHHHQHAQTSSPYIFLSAASSSDEVCGNGGSTGVNTGKTATLSSPSALYFYNNNSAPTMYSADFLRL